MHAYYISYVLKSAKKQKKKKRNCKCVMSDMSLLAQEFFLFFVVFSEFSILSYPFIRLSLTLILPRLHWIILWFSRRNSREAELCAHTKKEFWQRQETEHVRTHNIQCARTKPRNLINSSSRICAHARNPLVRAHMHSQAHLIVVAVPRRLTSVRAHKDFVCAHGSGVPVLRFVRTHTTSCAPPHTLKCARTQNFCACAQRHGMDIPL